MKRILPLTLAGILLAALAAAAQEPTLTFFFDPGEVTVTPGGEAGFRLVIENSSVHEADDVTVTLKGPEGFSIRPAPGVIEQLAPFTNEGIDFTLSASCDLPHNRYELLLQVVYTYCIDVSCFQIDDELTLPVMVSEEEIMVSPILPQGKRSPLIWLAPTLGVLLILGSILLWRFVGLTLPLYLVLVLLIAGGLTYGVVLKQHEQAQGIAAVLCTSCVGIEEAKHETPKLDPFTISALARLEEDVELIVFYAPWCHSCPYAEAMVEAMAAQTEHITYHFINVDEQRDLAVSYGIVRFNRTVVPAILRLETGEVLFGVGELEERLLSLLGVEK